ncbi:MAG: AAA family ATPase, partial [Singulisphaera sp.]
MILSPVVQIPVELERQLWSWSTNFPAGTNWGRSRGDRRGAGELPEGDKLGLVLDAASGLTRMEAEGAFSLSLVRHGRSCPRPLGTKQALKKSGCHLHRGGERFDDLGGLDALKGSRRRCSGAVARTSLRPRGVLLLSPPGCGKSQFAKSLGNEMGRPTLILDVGSLMGSLVGQTEERTRQALRIADAMSPCILFVDEIEKGFSGAASSGSTDSGVSARLLGSFLTWLSDHESDVFVVATSNDISKLPPEFSRAERWDGTFFLDLPGRKEKEDTWRMYIERFGLDRDQPTPNDRDWTGAEIKSACRLSALLDVSLAEAAQN